MVAFTSRQASHVSSRTPLKRLQHGVESIGSSSAADGLRHLGAHRERRVSVTEVLSDVSGGEAGPVESRGDLPEAVERVLR